MINLFFAVMEHEFKPMICMAPRQIPGNYPPGSPILLQYKDQTYRAVIVSEIFQYDEKYRDMLERHYGIDEMPYFVGTYTYNEKLFDPEIL